MITERFEIKYYEYTKTSKGELNLIGTVITYFDAIFDDCNDETKSAYIANYNKGIFPYINLNKPVTDYDDFSTRELIHLIQKRNNYGETTITTRINNLVYSPINYYSENIAIEDFMFGSSIRMKKTIDDIEDKYAIELKIRKSLSVKEEKRVAREYLLNPQTIKGEEVGLTIMFLAGCRNEEACGLNFGDMLEMLYYPNVYYLQLYETTENTSNALKLSGKSYNTPRRIPCLDVLKDFIKKRRDYVKSQIKSFPYVADDGAVYNNVDEMPMVCKGNNLGRRCYYKDLTYAGTALLRDVIKRNESEVAALSECMLQDYGKQTYLGEKDVTTYLLRRNMATHLASLGLDLQRSQYFMGHNIENTLLTRADFTDEDFLYEIYQIIRKHPLNNYIRDFIEYDGGVKEYKNLNDPKVLLKTNKPVHISIQTREVNEQLIVRFESKTEIMNKAIGNSNPLNTNIVKQIGKAYKKKN